MFAPVTKTARMVASADEIATAVAECGAAAVAAPSGPVYLGVPTDLLGQAAGRPAVGPGPRPGAEPPTRDAGAPESPRRDVERARDLLAGAERPLVWAGGGAFAPAPATWSGSWPSGWPHR